MVGIDRSERVDHAAPFVILPKKTMTPTVANSALANFARRQNGHVQNIIGREIGRTYLDRRIDT